MKLVVELLRTEKNNALRDLERTNEHIERINSRIPNLIKEKQYFEMIIAENETVISNLEGDE